MKNLVVRALTLTLCVLLAACASSGSRGIEVTRFHVDKALAPQPLNIEAADTGAKDSLAFTTYSGIIAGELQKIGFEPVAGDTAGLIAAVKVTRSIQQAPPKRSAFSIGIGGGSYGSGGGIGGGVNMPVGGNNDDAGVFVTELNVKLVERAGNAVLWEGSAVSSTPSGAGSATDVVQQLATAMFQDFPGESGKTVTVK